MTKRLNHPWFVYSDELEAQTSRTFVARLPAGISSSQELLAKLALELRFPDYFGSNWDALSDCLRDFMWLEEDAVLLVHADIPPLPSVDLAIYLEVLGEAVESWSTEVRRGLVVQFPRDAARQLAELSDAFLAERKEWLRLFLSQFFNHEHYAAAIVAARGALESDRTFRQRWSFVCDLISDRGIGSDEALRLVHEAANQNLDESTGAEAYAWLDRMATNVNRTDGVIVDY